MSKPILRKAAYAARKIAHETAGIGRDLTQALLAEIGPLHGQVIAGYMPIRTEADPRPAMTALVAENRVCVPVIFAAGEALAFREWHPDAVLIEGPFGTQVPAEGADLTPNILIVPLVAFDLAGNRLGYGGGFYDRTLQRLRAAGAVRAVGLAYGAQVLPELPVEPTDQPLDAIVTEAGTLPLAGAGRTA
ncbi:MAG: 5-formyltetrahydrofolate cyclo-ligase [Pseudomonadota bacterium]